MKQFNDYRNFSELAKDAKLPRVVLRAAKKLADKELAEIKAWMRLTGNAV